MDKLKWKTVEYPIADFAPAGKVITQRDVLEKYKAQHPNDEVKTFSGFKCDQQDKTVSLRIAVADPTIATDSGTIAKIESVWAGENRCLCGASGDNIKFQKKYDALVEAVGKDAQKFSAMLVENEELKKQLEVFLDEDYIAGDDAEDSADLVEAKKAIAEGGDINLDEVESTLIPTSDELADAAVKVAESEATGKPLLAPREEITVDEAKERYNIADGTLDGEDKCDCCGNDDCGEVKEGDEDVAAIAIKKACDQAEVVGPDEDDDTVPEDDEDDRNGS